MIIEFNAFKNCTSLKEIHLEKCNFPINTNIYNSNIPDDMRIIISDKVYNDSLKTEIRSNHYRLTRYTDHIQEKIDKISNIKIIQSIIYIDKFILESNDLDIINALKNIVEQLKIKYNISKSIINYVNYLLDKKLEIV